MPRRDHVPITPPLNSGMPCMSQGSRHRTYATEEFYDLPSFHTPSVRSGVWRRQGGREEL